MTKQEKIQAIQEEIADKTLKLGCKCLLKDDGEEVTISDLFTIAGRIKDEYSNKGEEVYIRFVEYSGDVGKEDIGKRLGCPVKLNDVIDWMWKQEDIYRLDSMTLLTLWKEKRKDISEQSEQCIDYILDLISKYKKDEI